MKIKVNGKEKIVEKDGLSVAELLTISDVENPEVVSVQRNGEFVNKEDYSKVKIEEDDEIDFLYFMGGGSL